MPNSECYTSEQVLEALKSKNGANIFGNFVVVLPPTKDNNIFVCEGSPVIIVPEEFQGTIQAFNEATPCIGCSSYDPQKPSIIAALYKSSISVFTKGRSNVEIDFYNDAHGNIIVQDSSMPIIEALGRSIVNILQASLVFPEVRVGTDATVNRVEI